MLAGKIAKHFGDSLSFVYYDVGDPVPMANESFLYTLQTDNNLTIYNMAVPAAKAYFQYVNGAFCGLRPNISSISSFTRGLGVNFSIFMIGTNDWGSSPEGLTRFISSLRICAESEIRLLTPRIALCAPPLKHFTGDEPENDLGETFTEYGSAIINLASELQEKYPLYDIKSIDLRSTVPNEQIYYTEDNTHLRENAHSLLAEKFQTELESFGWL